MSAPTTEDLRLAWAGYHTQLMEESIRASRVIELLGNPIPGITIPPPPQIIFQPRQEPVAPVEQPTLQLTLPAPVQPTIIHTRKRSRSPAPRNWNWSNEIREILTEAPDSNFLFSGRKMSKVLSEKLGIPWEELPRESISTIMSQLYKLGEFGRIERGGGSFEYGSMKYFKDPTSLKPKYRHFEDNHSPESVGHVTLFSQLLAPKKLIIEPEVRILTESEIETWMWREELVHFLEMHNYEKTGFLSLIQILQEMEKINKGLEVGTTAIRNTVSGHLSRLHGAGKIGGCFSLNANKRIYGAISYFSDKDTPLPEYDYMMIDTEEPKK